MDVFLKGRLFSVESSIEKKKNRRTFTEQLRVSFNWVLEPAARGLHRLGVQPNLLTLSGLLGTTVAAYLVSQGSFSWGGFTMLLMGPIDALDGALARLRGEPEDFGAFVDSVTDRYSELVIYLGLLWYSLSRDEHILALLAYLAAFGSVLVSYTRARAQSLGLEAKVGLFSRVERFLILGPALLFNIPLVGVSLIAVGANLTALQRILHVRGEARKNKS